MVPFTATAHPNIAFIKYWGNRDHTLRLPSSGSISMNLDGLQTRTQVIFDRGLEGDRLFLNGRELEGKPLERVSTLLKRVRAMARLDRYALVKSENNFPAGTGLASSASAFAALALAASRAAGLECSEAELSRLARSASGSACRSVPGGFVEWQAGEDDFSSYAYSIAPPEHWDLTDCIAIISQEQKPMSSQEGHRLADTSPLQAARVADAPRRLDLCRRAILKRDFEALAEVAELDSNLMHAVMMTSTPRVLYWQPTTLLVIKSVSQWRKQGLPVFYTIDAGPNVHVICLSNYSAQIAGLMREISGVQEVRCAKPGGPARYLAEEISNSSDDC